MGALTSKYNDTPEVASRYDADRDGFAPGLGAGTVVVEELEHALARGANIDTKLPAMARLLMVQIWLLLRVKGRTLHENGNGKY